MKEEVDSILAWLSDSVKKYGIIVLILLSIWLGIRRIWFWLVMPVMFLVFLQQLSALCQWKFINQINVFYLIISWIFIFSSLKMFFNLIIEKDK
jgi:hypothetical protein